MRSLRIAHVAPVATTIPPPKSGSVEQMTSWLTEGLVARGHDVTLFATADSKTKATLHATFTHGYWSDPNMWPWELYEMLNLAAAVERATDFDIIHYEAAYYPMSLAFTRLSPTPIIQTLHHSPSEPEVRLWSRYPEAPFVAISSEQARLLSGLHVLGTVLHGIDTDSFTFCDRPDDYVLFLGRFTDGKGVLQAIEIAKRLDMRLILAAAEDAYYREKVAPHVDGHRIVYYGEADQQGEALRRRARAALSDPIARAVRSRPGRGDGLRDTRRRSRSRRRARGRGRRRHRYRVRRLGSHGEWARACVRSRPASGAPTRGCPVRYRSHG
jgi:glycosyltransferase involved in cell wall biosynthesis